MSSLKSIVEIPSSEQSSNLSHRDDTLLSLGLSFIPCLFVLLMIFIFFKHNSYQKSLYQKSRNLKKISEYPCLNCKFYSDNHYFQCAVQPSMVLTPQATDCQDYQQLTTNNEDC